MPRATDSSSDDDEESRGDEDEESRSDEDEEEPVSPEPPPSAPGPIELADCPVQGSPDEKQ